VIFTKYKEHTKLIYDSVQKDADYVFILYGEKEDWTLRKNILRDIVNNGYYDYYGCYDPLFELSEKFCKEP